MAKKKRKNSDYHYSERTYVDERAKLQEAAVMKEKKNNMFRFLGGLGLLVVSLILALVDNKNQVNNLNIIYSLASGLGVILIGRSYGDTRKKFQIICYGVGGFLLFAGLLLFRQNFLEN